MLPTHRTGLLQCIGLIVLVCHHVQGACKTGQIAANDKCYASEEPSAVSDVTFGWHYTLTKTTSKSHIEARTIRVYQILNNDLQLQGLGLCHTDECSELDIQVTDEDGSKFNLVVTILGEKMRNVVGNKMALEDALRQPFDDRVFDFDDTLGKAPADKTHSFYFSAEVFCETGFELLGTNCAECAPGYFHDITTGVCTLCDVSKYQDVAGQTTCLPCQADKTTYDLPADSPDDCKEICGKGMYFDLVLDRCKNCDYGFWQSSIGQGSCIQCDVGQTTYGEGGKTKSSCTDQCPSGEELQEDDTCAPCGVGTYLTQGVHRLCKQCPGDFTTNGEGSTSEADCNLMYCQAGEYRVGSGDMCEKCRYDTYREGSNPDQTQCKSCGNQYRTDVTGATSRNQCKFFCEGGLYISGFEKCTPCDKNTYKTANQYYATKCEDCPVDRQTRSTGSSELGDCAFAKCQIGQKIDPADSLVCVDCPLDTYQPFQEPVDQDCEPCPEGQATRTNGSAACEQYCQSGQELNSTGSCINCQMRFYKDNEIDVLAKFQPCSRCPSGFTTTTDGSASSGDCTLRLCPAGHYRFPVDNECLECTKGKYQTLSEFTLDSCESCPPEYTTVSTGSTLATDCNVRLNQTTLAFQLRVKQEFVDDYWKPESAQFKNLEGRVQSEVGKVLTDIASFANKVHLRAAMEYPSKSLNILILHVTAAFNIRLSNSELETQVLDALTSAVAVNETIGDMEVDKMVPGAFNFSIIAVDPTLQCPYGWYLDYYHNGDCKKCPVGEYNPQSEDQGIKVEGVCVRCPGGNTTVGIGTYGMASDVCKKSCQQGEEGHNATCRQCLVGHYKDSVSVGECEPCPDGTTTRSTGGLSRDDCIVSCDEGLYRDGTVCKPCPRDSYTDKKDQDDCVSCPSLHTTVSVGSTACVSPKALCELNKLCGQHGDCMWDGVDAVASCECHVDYLGPTCADESTSGGSTGPSDMLIYGIAGGGGLVILIVLIVGFCWCCRRSASKQSKLATATGMPPENPMQNAWMTSAAAGNVSQPYPQMAPHPDYFVSPAVNQGSAGAVFQPSNKVPARPVMDSIERTWQGAPADVSMGAARGRRGSPPPQNFRKKKRKTTLLEANAKWNTQNTVSLAQPNLYSDNDKDNKSKKKTQRQNSDDKGVSFASGVQQRVFDNTILPDVAQAGRAKKDKDLKGNRKVQMPDNYEIPRVQVNNPTPHYETIANTPNRPDNVYDTIAGDEYVAPLPPGTTDTTMHVPGRR